MEDLLRWIVELIAKAHDRIMSINDGWQLGLDDKQLHFVVVGIFGIAIFFAIQVVFKWLAKRSVTAISLIYTATLVLVATFAIEIGQRVSGTGEMESRDIYYGVWGFFAAFGVYLVIKGVVRLVRRLSGAEQNPQPAAERHYIGDRRGGPKG